ncbi:MAG: hypothetical protein ACOCZE_07385 [Planctomycetota bacterium]
MGLGGLGLLALLALAAIRLLWTRRDPIRWIGLVVYVGLWVKVAFEATQGAGPSSVLLPDGVHVVPASHLGGLVAGTLIAYLGNMRGPTRTTWLGEGSEST